MKDGGSDAKGGGIATIEEKFILEIYQLMEENPVYDSLPKPTVDYIEKFLKRQPSLKSLAYIERREHLMNMLIYGYIRDKLFARISKIMEEEHPEDWEKFIEPKHLRLLSNIIDGQEEIIPRIFEATHEGFTEYEVGKKIKVQLSEKLVEFEMEAKEPKKVEAKVVDQDEGS